MPSTFISLLTPTALGNSERHVVQVSLRKKVWSLGTLIFPTFSTSQLATRSIIPPNTSLLPVNNNRSKYTPAACPCVLFVLTFVQLSLKNLIFLFLAGVAVDLGRGGEHRKNR